jgi:hypothetical protein
LQEAAAETETGAVAAVLEDIEHHLEHLEETLQQNHNFKPLLEQHIQLPLEQVEQVEFLMFPLPHKVPTQYLAL